MQISFVDEPTRFTEKLNTLCDELEERVNNDFTVFDNGEARIMVLGTPFAAPNWKLHEIVESSGGAIINEESCIGHRYFKDDVEIKNNSNEQEILELDVLDTIAGMEETINDYLKTREYESIVLQVMDVI